MATITTKINFEDTTNRNFFMFGFDSGECKIDKIKSKSPFRIITRDSTVGGSLEVWQLPKSKYAIQHLAEEKGDYRWRVIEVYVTKDGQIRTRGDLPYKDYTDYLEALDHIQHNFKVEDGEI